MHSDKVDGLQDCEPEWIEDLLDLDNDDFLAELFDAPGRVAPDLDEFDITECDDLHRLERAYVEAVQLMEDFEQGRRPDYSGHRWHGAANDALAALDRIEELGLYREAEYEDMDTYRDKRLFPLCKRLGNSNWSRDGF
jgi:hypothetical protein